MCPAVVRRFQSLERDLALVLCWSLGVSSLNIIMMLSAPHSEQKYLEEWKKSKKSNTTKRKKREQGEKKEFSLVHNIFLLGHPTLELWAPDATPKNLDPVWWTGGP